MSSTTSIDSVSSVSSATSVSGTSATDSASADQAVNDVETSIGMATFMQSQSQMDHLRDQFKQAMSDADSD